MITVIYNKQSQKPIKTFKNGYFIDGKKPDLPEHIVELNLIKEDMPAETETHKPVANHYADLENGVYVYGHDMVEKSQAEKDAYQKRKEQNNKRVLAEDFLYNLDIENMNQSQLINAVKALIILNR